MDYGAISDSGQVRQNNEDRYTVFTVQDKLDIIAVADGMGGHNAGGVASSLAIQTVENYKFSGANLALELEECIKEANKKIWQKATNKEQYQGMGTTLTVGIINEQTLTIGHVGDSRAYLYTEEELIQLTDDHSYTGQLVRNNLITREEAAEHPKRNLLTRALGVESQVEVDTKERKLTEDDLLLFCSDGITEMLSEKSIIEILISKNSLNSKVGKLTAAANEAGGYDNITVVLYKV